MSEVTEQWRQTNELLDALEAQDGVRICAAIGALRGRPADDPHDWMPWSEPYAMGPDRWEQARGCVHCREAEYRDAVPAPPSLTDCDPGDEQP